MDPGWDVLCGGSVYIDKALTDIQTGMIYRTRENGDVVKIIFRGGIIRQVLINDILVDDGSGVSGENGMTIGEEDVVAADWEEAKGF